MNRVLYLTLLTYAVIISGYVVAMAFPKGAVVGYGCVVAGLFTLVILKLVPLTHVPNLSVSTFLPMIPIIAILGISSWLLAINIKYSKNIEKGNLTSEYKTFNVMSFVLLLLQLVLIANEGMHFRTALISFICSFQLLVVFILQMNLEYFITDG